MKVLLVVLMAAVLLLPVIAFAESGGATIDDSGANTMVDSLKKLAVSGWGKLLFFASLLTGVICILFTRHRLFGLIALSFGVLIGVYGGVGESLWKLFSGLGGSGQ